MYASSYTNEVSVARAPQVLPRVYHLRRLYASNGGNQVSLDAYRQYGFVGTDQVLLELGRLCAYDPNGVPRVHA